MRTGIFTSTFARPTFEVCLDAIRAHGLEAVQLNMESVAGAPMPDEIPPELRQRIRAALAQRGIDLAAVSGTFNAIHPDERQRRDGLRRLGVLAGACKEMGAELITFCTGTLNPDSMWRPHSDNGTPAAWKALRATVEEAVCMAEEKGVVLVFEPEVNNVVDSALKARRLLDEVGSEHLQVVIDGANLFHAGELPRMRQLLDEAFNLLGAHIRLAHAKDLERDGDAGHQAAGTGVLDYEHYLRLLERSGFQGAVVLHSLQEEQVPQSLAFVRARMPG